MVADVIVADPKYDHDTITTVGHTAERAAQTKYTTYSIFDLNSNDILPLAFDCFGGCCDGTYNVLKLLANSVARNDVPLAEMVAREIHAGHFQVLSEYN